MWPRGLARDRVEPCSSAVLWHACPRDSGWSSVKNEIPSSPLIPGGQRPSPALQPPSHHSVYVCGSQLPSSLQTFGKSKWLDKLISNDVGWTVISFSLFQRKKKYTRAAVRSWLSSWREAGPASWVCNVCSGPAVGLTLCSADLSVFHNDCTRALHFCFVLNSKNDVSHSGGEACIYVCMHRCECLPEIAIVCLRAYLCEYVYV